MMIAIAFAFEKEAYTKTRIQGFFISLFVAVGIWGLSSLLTTTTTITHTDVLEYKGTIYSVPKTFIETKDDAPFWSMRDGSNMTLVESK